MRAYGRTRHSCRRSDYAVIASLAVLPPSKGTQLALDRREKEFVCSFASQPLGFVPATFL
jgi:hypothetical protein